MPACRTRQPQAAGVTHQVERLGGVDLCLLLRLRLRLRLASLRWHERKNRLEACRREAAEALLLPSTRGPSERAEILEEVCGPLCCRVAYWRCCRSHSAVFENC